MPLNPSATSRILVRATNWLGDAVMSLPAIRAVRTIFPHAHLAVLGRPWLSDLYARERAIDRIIPYPAPKSLSARRDFARELRTQHYDTAILLQNAFDAALITWLARIPTRIGYARDARSPLLTHPIPVPDPGDIPRHERFYYLELLRRAGLLSSLPPDPAIQFDNLLAIREAGRERLAALGLTGPVLGVSPGAAYGNAKRWLPERFAEAAARLGLPTLVFGAAGERPLCDEVSAAIPHARNLAGQTTLREFLDLTAACALSLTNDSGAMHVSSALGTPTVTIFGATDDTTTGPTGPLARVVRDHAECSPCLLRECPIDHRCMTRVSTESVVSTARQLLSWTLDTKS